jgi:hypothetical protein
LQRGALALREAGLTGLAAEQAPLLGAVAHGGGQVAAAALAVVRAVGVLAAEGTQVVRRGPFLVHGPPLLGIHGSAKSTRMLHQGPPGVQ